MFRQDEALRVSCLTALAILLTLCFALAALQATYPSADGDVVYQDGGTTVDASHADQGYIMVKHSKLSKRLKLRLTLGDQMYTYDLNNDGTYVTYPLTFGNGKYQLQVFKQASGNRYSNDSSLSFSVELADDTLPYLCPNQYVWYTEDSAAVAKGAQLCEGLETDLDKIKAIRKYVVSAILYDYVLASTVQTGYIPDVDSVLATGKGICFDYATLTACMLRTQGIPTQLVIGYADQIYHAWNNVWLDNEWVRIDTTAEANHMVVGTYTAERVY